MPEDGSSVVCCVTLQAVTLKLTLSAKLLSSKSLENGVLNPFLKAFNKKMPSTAHKFAENIERLELEELRPRAEPPTATRTRPCPTRTLATALALNLSPLQP